MSESKQPSVIRFEQAVKSRDHERACSELLHILSQLDTNFGSIQNIEIDFPDQLEGLDQDKVVHLCTRMAVAMTSLFTDPELFISDVGTRRFLILQRWIALLFASSPYINADHILQTYNRNQTRDNPKEIFLENTKVALNKFCILYLPESSVSLNLDAMWELDSTLCASLCFALQSPRFIGTPNAFSKRAAILQWFPEKLLEIQNLSHLPSNISHDVYMHCSYDIAPNKHLIKKSLNQVIRGHITELGWSDRDVSHIGYKNGKPVMVVLLEHFHSAHSIYRTHSTSMIAAKQHFYLIGVGNEAVDQAGRDVFDEFNLISGDYILDKLNYVKEICEKFGAAILYMPSIGMDLTSIFISNTRLAPIQAIALGHPATTYSNFIEYVIVEDDYVGSEDCFSEKLLRLPKDALPYVPSALAPNSVEYKLRENPEVVNIGIASTTMKLNPYFLAALKAIRDRAKVKVHFHFALGQSFGITHPYVERFIKSYLGDSATAHSHSPYDQYLRILYQCDMMLNPFPFGNTNGIIDMVTLGLVGVCKTGPEVHEHIDEGLFKRLGLPEWLVATTVDEYVERAIRLAENHQERLSIRRHIIENNGLKTLFTGDPSPMGNVFLEKLKEWANANNVTLDILPSADNKKAKPTKSKVTRKRVKKEDSQSVDKKKGKESIKKDSEKVSKTADKKTVRRKSSPLKDAVKKLKKDK